MPPWYLNEVAHAQIAEYSLDIYSGYLTLISTFYSYPFTSATFTSTSQQVSKSPEHCLDYGT